MNFNFKKIVTAACMAAFLATSFLPGISEAANGRMSLAQAQQQVKRPYQRSCLSHLETRTACPAPPNETPQPRF